MSLELLSPPGVPPILQRSVDIQVSEQWAGDSSLRGPAAMVLPTCQPIFTVLVQFLGRNHNPHLNQMQHVPVDHSPDDTLYEFAVGNRTKYFDKSASTHLYSLPLVAYAISG